MDSQAFLFVPCTAMAISVAERIGFRSSLMVYVAISVVSV